jgi:hypothetical protein
MNAIGDRAPTSEHGLLRRAQHAKDAGMQSLIDGAAQVAAAANATPPAQPVAAAPRDGSTVHVVA